MGFTDWSSIMPRAAVEIRLSEVERRELENLSRAHKVWQSLARRARIVLLAADGLTNLAIADRLGTSNLTVGKWRQRFAERRLDGLYDEPRRAPRDGSATTTWPRWCARPWRRRPGMRPTGARVRWPGRWAARRRRSIGFGRPFPCNPIAARASGFRRIHFSWTRWWTLSAFT